MKLLIPPPVQGLIVGAAMWGVARATPQLVWSFTGQRAVAGVLIGVGVLMEIVAVATFFHARTTVNPMAPDRAKTLVAAGLFRFSRNPMYLALLLVLVGWALWLGDPLNVLLVAGFVAYITRFQIEPEEAALRAKFGADYDAYSQRVRRWL